MRLILSSEAARNAVMSNESGQVLYKTFHPLKLGLSQGTTTIQKIKPNDDPMDMRDQFDVLAQISNGIWRRPRRFACMVRSCHRTSSFPDMASLEGHRSFCERLHLVS